MRIAKAGLSYFALVLGAGIVLGAVRVPLLVPRLGVRVAELLEMPVMLLVILLAARFVARRFELPRSVRERVTGGLLALAWLVCTELVLALGFHGQSPAQFVASRDPVSGGVFLVMLGVYAAMPYLLAHGPEPR